MRIDKLRPATAAAIAALAVVAACRSVPPRPAPALSWEARRPQLQALGHFELRGRVAVAAAGEGFNASVRWIQQGAHAQLTLAGPLGVGGAQVSAAGDELTLLTPHGEQLDNAAAHAELAARLGFDPPLSSLRYWVLGVPDPGQPATEALDASQQRLAGLTQSGWHIDYLSYGVSGGESLPARLTLQRDAVRVRLLVDDWRL
jgi:outer membrane lipoprotein LolB